MAPPGPGIRHCWRMQDKQQNGISVAWNNSFRSILNCCRRESFCVLKVVGLFVVAYLCLVCLLTA